MKIINKLNFMDDIEESINEIDSILTARINEMIDQLRAEASSNEIDPKLRELSNAISSGMDEKEKQSELKNSVNALDNKIEKVKSKNFYDLIQRVGDKYSFKLD